VPLGDFFVPDPIIVCPICGSPIPEWEGFGGAGAFVVFRQGQAEPVEARLASQVPEGGAKLADGIIPLFVTCKEEHPLMAEATVEGGVFSDIEVSDADGGMPMRLVGGFVMWRAVGARFSVSTLRPTEEQGVIPASITAIGFNDDCILATRRRDTRDPNCEDEWFFVDVKKKKVVGPVPDAEIKDRLAEEGLPEPEVMSLPEDVG
jgi:hypothetical protein